VILYNIEKIMETGIGRRQLRTEKSGRGFVVKINLTAFKKKNFSRNSEAP